MDGVSFDRYAGDLVERARPFGPSDRILDLGCGTGIVARVLRERLGGGARLTGIDISAPMIAKARALAPDIAWHEGTACALPFADGSFDVVLAQQLLEPVPDRKLAVREVRRVLAPGGRLVASAWKPPHLDDDELRVLLTEAGFTAVNKSITNVITARVP